MIQSITGTGKGIFDVALELSSGEGVKDITRSIWTGSLIFTGKATITLDTIPPTIAIVSHQSGFSTTGASILLTGTYVEANVATITISGEVVPFTGGIWSTSLSLHTGTSMFTVHITDEAGHQAETEIAITRLEIINGVCGTAH
ncbi:MAG: hypothetical protein LBU27_05160 [Candidatus Peribacteria bacterium]|nr:hypothetical protein [Candidatus Peribacteria bacterium]